MAGKLEKSRVHFLRAVDEWEYWTFTDNKRPHFVRRLSSPSEIHSQMVVALPARCTITFPTWLSTDDRAVIPEMLHLQLEKRGLLGKNGGGLAADYRVIETRQNQTLAIAMILQPEFPKELVFEKAQRYEPSAYTFPLPQDRLVIWRERGRLAVAATRGREAVAVQVLGDDTLSDTAVLELKCIMFELESQQLCERFLGITLWGEFSVEEAERLERSIGLKVIRDAVPPPDLPKIKSRLMPPEVHLLHEKRRRRNRIVAGILWLAALYVVSVIGVIGYIWWERRVAENLRTEIEEQTPTVTAIQATAQRWKQIEWAVNPKLYPVEILFQVAGLLPPDGLRLTAFEMQGGKVVIHGESSTAPAAFKFAEDIKAKADLQMFTWQMPSPTLRPDGRADFTIEGNPKVATIN
jgi:hypothetical protein